MDYIPGEDFRRVMSYGKNDIIDQVMYFNR
jgi:hypothetical protein